jgi:8-amino-7-oxononanoate synthase
VKHPPPPFLAYLHEELARLERSALLRGRPSPLTSTSFCSNDYLGLARHGSVPPGASFGAGASRLVTGEHSAHQGLERGLAAWLSTESALVFTSGYAANVGTIAALVGPSDLIVSDAFNHASIVDGCRLSRATVRVFPHLDVAAAGALLDGGSFRRRWLITESYFSMDADSPDLAALRSLTHEQGAGLMVDEAHALGVLGPDGRGLCRAAGVVPDVLVGTLGKAFGAGGAFVAGGSDLTAWLWNRARSFVFSTGLSPAVAAAASRSLGEMQARPELRAECLARADELRSGLVAIGLPAIGHGHVVPVVVGESSAATGLAARVQAQGFFVQAIRPPSVPPGTARIRLTGSTTQTPADIQELVMAFKSAMR